MRAVLHLIIARSYSGYVTEVLRASPDGPQSITAMKTLQTIQYPEDGELRPQYTSVLILDHEHLLQFVGEY